MLEEGDIIELEKGHKVYADVPEHFLYSNKRGSFSLAHGLIILNEEVDYLCGEYVVYKTSFDGGGTGMGPHDIFPNGHHVYCEKLKDPLIRVDFYQSGCFTAMNEHIKPIRKATRHWVDRKNYFNNVEKDER